MAALKEESKLYKELSDSFEDNKKGITLDFYKSAIEIARKQCLLVKLKSFDFTVFEGCLGL